MTIISTITRLIAFVFKIYLSRALGAEVLGIYQISMSIFVLLLASSASGIPIALSRHTATLSANGDTIGTRGILTSALIMSGGIALAIIAFCYIFPNVTSLLFSDKRCTRMFYIMLPALFSASIYSVIRGYFWGKKDYLIYSGAELMEEILSALLVILTIALGLFGDNLSESIAISFLISDYIGTILLAVVFVLRGGRLARPRMFRSLSASAVPMTSTRLLGSSMSSMMALLIPLLLVHSGLSNGDATASYGRASGMVMPLVFVPSTIISALVVVVIPELATIKRENRPKTVARSLTLSLLIASLFLAIFIAVGDKVCLVLYNDKLAGEYMRVATYLMIPMSFNQMAVSLLNTLGYENKTFRTHIIGSSVLAVLVLVLPHFIGIYAYFVGLLVFHILTGFIYLRLINKYVGTRLRDIRLGILSVLFAIIISHLLRLIPLGSINPLLGVIIMSIIIFILYIIFAIRTHIVDISVIGAKLRHSR